MRGRRFPWRDKFLKWNSRNRRAVIIAACITVLFVVWLWGFTHQPHHLTPAEAPQDQSEPPQEEPEQGTSEGEQEEDSQGSDSRYLPSSDAPAKKQEQGSKKPEAAREEPEEPAEEPEPAPEEPSEKDVPPEEDVPEWQSGWKEPEWPEWPDWEDRQTIPRRTVTGTVGSVPRWGDR